jgi:hypothetical protein
MYLRVLLILLLYLCVLAAFFITANGVSESPRHDIVVAITTTTAVLRDPATTVASSSAPAEDMDRPNCFVHEMTALSEFFQVGKYRTTTTCTVLQ